MKVNYVIFIYWLLWQNIKVILIYNEIQLNTFLRRSHIWIKRNRTIYLQDKMQGNEMEAYHSG